jgi:hypothetical protein
MPVLADVERLLERVFERTTARAFRARIQVVQVERRVERAMERARTSRGSQTSVPSRYRVRLRPADLEILAADAGGPEVLAGRLADEALAFARAHGYHLGGRPSVALVADPSVDRGAIEVDAVADGHRAPVAGTVSPMGQVAQPVPVPDMPAIDPRPGPAEATAGVEADAGTGPASPAPGQPAVFPVAMATTTPPTPVVLVPDPAPPAGAGGIRGDGTQTLVFRRPAPEAARALLRVIAPDGTERTVEVDGTPLTLGRARDNTLVLADNRVSRHHGRVQARRGTLVYTDLSSTNGSRINGIRVDECALGMGDRIVVGDTVLLVEHLPG